MADDSSSLQALLAARSEMLASGSNWSDFTDVQCDDALVKLAVIQDAIVEVPLHDSESKLAVLAALLDSNDQPGFADNFKNRLFDSLRSYVHTPKQS